MNSESTRERVVRWQGISIAWPRPPQTFQGAKNRIEQLQTAIHWMLLDLDGGEHSRARLEQEIRHYQNLLTARWEANEARLTKTACDCGGPDCKTDGKGGEA